jgi:Raf kinase inhibitor-like YbhB/YbcL family protein
LLKRTGFCVAGAALVVICTAASQDRNPAISWSAGPPGTQSYVLLMVDPDVTADLSLMNKPGVTIPRAAPRMNIYHWVLIDIDATLHRIRAGAEGDGFVQGGKPIGVTPYGLRGTNDYWPYFNNNSMIPAAMKGPYGGFDGPCPPSNDLLVHRYVFEVFALDVRSLDLSGRFFASDVLAAMQGHILAQGAATTHFSFAPPPPGSHQAAAGLDGTLVSPSAPRR